jgi:hypothetical protein
VTIAIPSCRNISHDIISNDVSDAEREGPARAWHRAQLLLVTDLNVSPVWEINIGVAIGGTASTDHIIVKAILGGRFDWGRHSLID